MNCGSSASCSIIVLRELNVQDSRSVVYPTGNCCEDKWSFLNLVHSIHQPVSLLKYQHHSANSETHKTILSPYRLQARKQEAWDTPEPLSFSVSLSHCFVACTVFVMYTVNHQQHVYMLSQVLQSLVKSGYAFRQVVMALCSDAPYWNKEIHLNLDNGVMQDIYVLDTV